MFIQEHGMVAMQLVAHDLFLKAKSQMAHVRSFFIKASGMWGLFDF